MKRRSWPAFLFILWEGDETRQNFILMPPKTDEMASLLNCGLIYHHGGAMRRWFLRSFMLIIIKTRTIRSSREMHESYAITGASRISLARESHATSRHRPHYAGEWALDRRDAPWASKALDDDYEGESQSTRHRWWAILDYVKRADIKLYIFDIISLQIKSLYLATYYEPLVTDKPLPSILQQRGEYAYLRDMYHESTSPDCDTLKHISAEKAPIMTHISLLMTSASIEYVSFDWRRWGLPSCNAH